MAKRRDFIKELGGGALSALALASAVQAAENSPPAAETGTGKKVRVGIIGAENSHTIGLGQTFNINKKFPGVEIVALWGETEEFAKNAAEKGGIPKIVKKQEELLGQIDALIVDHRHPKYHLEAARPFVAAGIPTFVDKPFAYRVEEARDFLDLAEKYKTPVTCLSSVAYGPGIDDITAQAGALENIESIIVTGPASLNSKYGGIFFYGVHSVERLFKVFGDDCEAVRATRQGARATFQFKFTSGKLATYILAKEWEVLCVTDKGSQALKPRFESDDQLYMYAAIVKMFQTGVEPRTHASILKTVAALEAMERSGSSEEWEYLTV